VAWLPLSGLIILRNILESVRKVLESKEGVVILKRSTRRHANMAARALDALCVDSRVLRAHASNVKKAT
jgi:hypothetical protein